MKVRDAQAAQGQSILDHSGGRSLNDVLYEDKKRDFRNVEVRKVIKQQTSAKRNSLVDSLMIAKSVIDAQAKSKEHEGKASERRRKIRRNSACPGGLIGNKHWRRKSFVEEVQNACSVIIPNRDGDEKMEESKAKRRTIKNQIAGKRRPSLLDEIQVAKSVIMESPKKYVLRPGLVEEVRLLCQKKGST